MPEYASLVGFDLSVFTTLWDAVRWVFEADTEMLWKMLVFWRRLA